MHLSLDRNTLDGQLIQEQLKYTNFELALKLGAFVLEIYEA